MQFPPFRGFGPVDAIKQLSQWVNQPMLTQALKDAAQKLGVKEVPQLSSIQELLRQAGRWVEAAVEPWTDASSSRLVPGINATGELFSARWTAPRLPLAFAPLSSLVHSHYTEDQGVEAHLKTLLIGATGAADALVTPNLAIALHLVGKGLVEAGKIDEIILPRMSCIRIPSGPVHGGVLARTILDASGARVTEIGTSTECVTNDYESSITDSKKLLFFASPVSGQAERSAGIARVKSLHGLVCELAMDGSLHDLQDLGIHTAALSRCWDSGVDLVIIPGHYLLSGPECGIILGRLDVMASIRSLAEQSGMLADRLTHLMLCESIRQTQTREEWMRTPTGATLSTSIENLENRARRIALQCDGVPSIERIEVDKQSCKLGSGVWQSTRMDSSILRVYPKQETASRLSERLKEHEPPIWCNVFSDRVELVMRTIEPSDDHLLVQALQKSPSQPSEPQPTQSPAAT